jgi:hypothetical protein
MYRKRGINGGMETLSLPCDLGNTPRGRRVAVRCAYEKEAVGGRVENFFDDSDFCLK